MLKKIPRNRFRILRQRIIMALLEELVKIKGSTEQGAGQVMLTAGEMHRCPPTFDGCGLPPGT